MSSITQTSVPYPFIGEIAALGAALIWSVSVSIFTRFSKHIPAYETNLFKNLVALFYILIALLIVSPPWPESSRDIMILALSGIIGLAVGDSFFFAALKKLGAQITSACQSVSPGLTAILAFLAFGEHLTLMETFGLVLTVSAVSAALIFNRKSGGSLTTLSRIDFISGIVFALIAASCQALGLVLARYALQNTHVLVGTTLRIAPAVVVLYLGFLVRGQLFPFKTLRVRPRSEAIGIAIAALLGTTLGLLLLAVATKYTKAGVAAALSSTYPIWIIPIAAIFLQERTTLKGTICTIIAVTGVGIMMGFAG